MDWKYIIDGLFIEWSAEYNIPKKRIRFGGFADLDPKTMGICRFPYDKNGIIQPTAFLSNHWLEFSRAPEFLIRSVAWHEFCHGETMTTTGENGHCKTWKDKRARKTMYVIGDCIAKFVWTTCRILKKW